MSPASVVTTRHEGDVAVVEIDNPPVNALSDAVRAGLLDALRQAEVDPTVRSVVISCAGRTFVAGADIREFGKPRKPPSLTDVIEGLETMTKPVVAAIHGTALGGGLELALGCHSRVALASARLGLPEVKLGLLPGGGGTQRLPRAIGAVPALRMIVSGEPVPAVQAFRDGLVDKLVEANLAVAAISHARELANAGSLRRLRVEDQKLAADRSDSSSFEAAATELTKRARGIHAPLACIEAVRGALDLPFDGGLARERALFEELVVGDQSRAQRYLFFAEREAAKIELPSGTKPRAIDSVAVIGAGTMGTGIAISLANAGIDVTLIDATDDALRRGLGAVQANFRDAAKRGRITAEDAERRCNLVQGAITLERVAGVDLVIEAVFEDLELKKEVFEKLDRIVRPGAILVTNTSYLDVEQIASATRRPRSVAGMHFFSPATIMRLVEIVRGRDTDPEVVATLVSLSRKLGKVPVVVGNCHGFVGNRMLRQRNISAERLLIEGALPNQVDAAMVEFGFPMGPFAATDLAGLDIGVRMRKAIGTRAEIADTLCELGRLGQKTGRGFYRYEPGSRAPKPDPEVEAIIVGTSERLGVERRVISDEEIIERLILPIVEEGRQVLAEGIASRASDIDLIWAHGYGWPVWRGGPMYYADTQLKQERGERHVEEVGM